MIKKIIVLTLTIVMVGALLAGCTAKPTGNSGDATPKPEQKTLTIGGSTSVQPLAEELAKKFSDKNPGVQIDIQGGGSGVGIKSTIDGVVDIGMSSRELKTAEAGLKEFKIAIDGIAVILNPENKVKDISKEQLMQIYTGAIKNWKEVGGADAAITVVTREEGSGTRGAFIELTKVEVTEGDKKVDKTVPTAITQGSTGAVITTVSQDPNAIGYASFGAVKTKTDVKMISVGGVQISEENIYAKTYVVSRPFLFLTKAEPTGLAKEFIDFILSSEGQEIIVSKNYLKASN